MIVKPTTRVTHVLLLALAAAATSCEREERTFRVEPPSADATESVAVSSLFPGAQPTTQPVSNDYEKNAYALAEGKRLFGQYNCSGCHANGGGGIGPPLMDERWRYGGSMEQIYASIVQGRPNGMPAFGGKIPEQQVWEIAAYVRTLSGNADKLAAPSRPDGMRSIMPLNNIDRQPPRGDPDATRGGGG